MSRAAWVFWILSVGVALEVAGVGLAFLEVRERAAALRRFLTTGATIYVSAQGHSTSFGSATVTGGRVPTLQEQVQDLQRGQQALDQRIDEAELRLRNGLTEQLRSSLDATERTASDRMKKSEALMVAALSGSRRAYVSLGCLLAGLALQAFSSVLSALIPTAC